MNIKSGDIIGKYKIGEVLGQGGMATVYKAVQEPLGRNVALKVLHQHLTIEKTVRERFLLEAQAIASMKHPNIVQVYDFEASDEVSFISMEYIDGGALDQQLKRRETGPDQFKPLPVKQALEIARDIAKALDYAHKFGIIHRDVKPANILIGTDGRYVLTDFGIATLLHQNRMTADGATSGTPTYIPPEMITGDRGDNRSDIYSLGIVLFQLLTGELPFNSENLYGILMKHINEPLPSLQSFNPDVDDAVSDIVIRAAEKNSEDRYQSGVALADEIQRLLEMPKYSHLSEYQDGSEALIVEPIESDKRQNWVEITKVRVTGLLKWVYQISRLDWRLKLTAGLIMLFFMISPIVLVLRAVNVNPDEFINEAESAVAIDEEIPIVAIQDEFDNNDLVWPTGGAPRWIQLVDGVYEQRIEEDQKVISSIPFNSPTYDQFVYQAQVRQKDGLPETGYGLIFNYQSKVDYMVFGINGRGHWSIWNLREREWESLQQSESGEDWIPSEFIKPAPEWNTLKVDVRDDEFDLFINDEFVGRISKQSSFPPNGQVGFYLATAAGASAQPSIIQFDNVEVTPQ